MGDEICFTEENSVMSTCAQIHIFLEHIKASVACIRELYQNKEHEWKSCPIRDPSKIYLLILSFCPICPLFSLSKLFSDESGISKWSGRAMVPLSLPVPISLDTTSASTVSSVSSQKSNTSPSSRKRLALDELPVDLTTTNICNGFAQLSALQRSGSPTMISAVTALEEDCDNLHLNVSNKEPNGEKSRIPRWIKFSPSEAPATNL